MSQEHAAGRILPAIVMTVSLCAVALADSVPAFDQGVDVAQTLKTVREMIREDRTPFVPSGGVLDATGFTTGNDFTATVIRGEVRVSCHDSGRSDTAWFRCAEEILEPAEFVHFRGPAGVDADKVSLTARWESGKTRKKSKGYDSEKGESTGHFNLWISTLFQRPLLDYGRNLIAYVMKKDGETVLEGSFTANVTHGETRRCRHRGYYSSSNISDCRGSGSNICRRYFRDENYCQ